MATTQYNRAGFLQLVQDLFFNNTSEQISPEDLRQALAALAYATFFQQDDEVVTGLPESAEPLGWNYRGRFPAGRISVARGDVFLVGDQVLQSLAAQTGVTAPAAGGNWKLLLEQPGGFSVAAFLAAYNADASSVRPQQDKAGKLQLLLGTNTVGLAQLTDEVKTAFSAGRLVEFTGTASKPQQTVAGQYYLVQRRQLWLSLRAYPAEAVPAEGIYWRLVLDAAPAFEPIAANTYSQHPQFLTQLDLDAYLLGRDAPGSKERFSAFERATATCPDGTTGTAVTRGAAGYSDESPAHAQELAYNKAMALAETALVCKVPAVPNQAPTVNLTGSSSTANTGQGITLTASPYDADGTITKVEYFDSGAKIGETTAAPHSIITPGLSQGRHDFTARTTDNGNATATSTIFSVAVSTPQQTFNGSYTAKCGTDKQGSGPDVYRTAQGASQPEADAAARNAAIAALVCTVQVSYDTYVQNQETRQEVTLATNAGNYIEFNKRSGADNSPVTMYLRLNGNIVAQVVFANFYVGAAFRFTIGTQAYTGTFAASSTSNPTTLS